MEGAGLQDLSVGEAGDGAALPRRDEAAGGAGDSGAGGRFGL